MLQHQHRHWRRSRHRRCQPSQQNCVETICAWDCGSWIFQPEAHFWIHEQAAPLFHLVLSPSVILLVWALSRACVFVRQLQYKRSVLARIFHQQELHLTADELSHEWRCAYFALSVTLVGQSVFQKETQTVCRARFSRISKRRIAKRGWEISGVDGRQRAQRICTDAPR